MKSQITLAKLLIDSGCFFTWSKNTHDILVRRDALVNKKSQCLELG